MKHKHFRIAADLPNAMRTELLRMLKPQLQQVYCRSITLAYRVTDEFGFPGGPVDAQIYAIHRTDKHEAFLLSVGANRFRPDGNRFFLTLSTAPGVPPADAGAIQSGLIEKLSTPIDFTLQFKRQPLWQQQPELVA